MKLIALTLLTVVLLAAQAPTATPKPRVISPATTQPAQSLTIPITSGMATVLETARTNAPYLDGAGKPMYSTISALVAANPALGNLFIQLAQQFPTTALKEQLEIIRAQVQTTNQQTQAAAKAAIAAALQ